MASQARAVRQPVDIRRLETYIRQHAAYIKTPIELKQFCFGQSNPTYQLTGSDGQRYVLRKRPPGKIISATAHRIDREFRVISALAKTDVPVPRAYLLCEDESIVGTSFYIMEFLDGRIFDDADIKGVAPDERREMWKSAVTTLARLHRVDYKTVGLQGFGKEESFYDRQIETITRISARQAATISQAQSIPANVGEIPHFHETMKLFRDRSCQPTDRATIVHGDFKINNLVFHKTEPRVIGILDWEMATVGHPLSDLTNLLTPYVPTTVNLGPNGFSPAFAIGATPGLPSREQNLELYHLHWAIAFGMLRRAFIRQDIAARAATGQASSAQAAEYGKLMVPLGLLAHELIEARMNE
ncbi:hypothetical protein M409DRAFT_66088 [Zasmidium cellare ATCC 36951]|uniref:Aminoglycoside phosphotransferase domain-containing protein n=1 Tax=Zasmidium cellare ATCC 36951 TaxID=1080233 RepID=A0A6A6CPB5_ZASCE|nr:uncharacterized protein M409DRAFT_66088 [Zasmidium cellare ATCC 36951]KAF2167599.1 hypothetical protein M409DRAFT_66088 [Zasmidium cellare ATCC 36951]